MARGSAQVAQLVEHATENRSVGGSIPPLGTSKNLALSTDYWETPESVNWRSCVGGTPGAQSLCHGFTPCATTPSNPAYRPAPAPTGYRLIVQREGERMRLFTRRGFDWSDRFPLGPMTDIYSAKVPAATICIGFFVRRINHLVIC
jgi:hypothetical protein